MTDPFAANLVHFVRYLRYRGVAVVPATAGELAEAIDIVGLDRRDDVYDSMRAMTVVRPSEREIFDEAFDLFFGSGQVRRELDPEAMSSKTTKNLQTRASVPIVARTGADSPNGGDEGEEVTEITGGSYEERLAGKDFRDLSPDEKEEVRRLIAKMMWRPSEHPSRRWGPSKTGPRPDMRRTFRNMAGPEGDLMRLAMADRRRRRRPLIILADISGSMERYTEMFLHFIHAAQGRLGRVEAFVFATRLSRITRQMRQKLPEVALTQIAQEVQDWSGGTRIGEALQTFNHDWSRRVTSGGAIGLIISDGWDTGDPALLHHEMSFLARSTHRVIWLNPLAGRSGFSPETRGLVTALPFVDDFLAAANILDLREVVRLLESIPARR